MTGRENPQLSIIIPIYNGAAYLAGCIESALKQNCTKQIICVDDGSNDGTAEILKQYAQKHEEIKVITHEVNQGTYLSRYDGISAAEGEFLTFIDADDEFVPYTLDRLCCIARFEKTDILEFGTKVNVCGDCSTKQAESNQQVMNPEARQLNNEDFCNLCFKENRISDAIGGKLFSERLYHKAFEAMEHIKLPNIIADADYIIWHMLLFAEKLQSVEQTGYIYFAGRGISHHAEESFAHLKEYCKGKVFYEALLRSAEKQNILETALPAISNIYQGIKMQSVRCWAQRLKKADQEKGLPLLIKTWGMTDIVDILTVLYKEDPEKIKPFFSCFDFPEKEGKGVVCLIHEELSDTEAQLLRAEAERLAADKKLWMLTEGNRDFGWEPNVNMLSLPVQYDNLTVRNWQLRILLDGIQADTIVTGKSEHSETDCFVGRSLGYRVFLYPQADNAI